MAEAIDHLKAEFPNFADIAGLPFDLAGIDSFALIELRAAIEGASGKLIDDASWAQIRTLSDIANMLGDGMVATGEPVFSRRRDIVINMPQMAVGGLSESWLLKELGDMHWSMIAEGLRTPSSRIVDGNGDRLYATFTRIILETAPLQTFAENDPLAIKCSLSRFGGGLFTGSFEGSSIDKKIMAKTMSSFAKRGEHGSNKSLLKGQPVIPDGSPIPALSEKPEIISEYSKVRQQNFDILNSVFTTEYEINPYYDVNGVGLVYFAAYPLISDICASKYFGRSYANQLSTVTRDIYYLSNADSNDTLVYHLLKVSETEDGTETEALISNRSGMVPMALVRTRKT